MHSGPKLPHTYLQNPGKAVPTLCISAPDDIYQETRDAIWSYHTKHRGPNAVAPESQTKLYPEDPITRQPKTLMGTKPYNGSLTYRHQFTSQRVPARNFSMPECASDKYNFDLPDVTPKINARFNPTKLVIPSIKSPTVVGRRMSLKAQSSYSSFEYNTDDEDEQDNGNSQSMTAGSFDYGLSSVVIRSMRNEKEQFVHMTSSNEEISTHASTDNVIEAVENVNRGSVNLKKSYSDNFIKVPTADSHFTQSLGISSGISSQEERQVLVEHERETRIHLRKRYSKPKRKSKRRSRGEPVLFTYKQLGSSSSIQIDTHSEGSVVDDENPIGKHCLKNLLENHIVIVDDDADGSDECVQQARDRFNSMVNTKEVLDESVYEDFARFNERANQMRRDSTLPNGKQGKFDDNAGDDSKKISIKWK